MGRDKIEGKFGIHKCKIMYVGIIRIIVAFSAMRSKLITPNFERLGIPVCAGGGHIEHPIQLWAVCLLTAQDVGGWSQLLSVRESGDDL